MKKIRYCRSDKVFYTISDIFLALLLLLVAYPLIYVLSASFSSGNAVSAGRVVLWPVDFSLEGYKAVFNKSDIWPAYLNTIGLSIISPKEAALCSFIRPTKKNSAAGKATGSAATTAPSSA